MWKHAPRKSNRNTANTEDRARMLADDIFKHLYPTGKNTLPEMMREIWHKWLTIGIYTRSAAVDNIAGGAGTYSEVMPMFDALQIAKWFLAWAETDESDEAEITNLKLQKLLYYAQGHYLAKNGTRLFVDELQAWSHGPVVPLVYRYFKQFGSGPLKFAEDEEFSWADIDDHTTQFLIDIWDTYGGIAAWKLRNMTHGERPWADAFDRDQRNVVIATEALKRHFESLENGKG